MNLEEEVLCGHLVTAETKRLWSVEIDLAQKLLEVCDKYNLKIWASYGTLLGVVRHNGFIPWDDDMDFVMMRDDYDKLVQVGPKEFKYPYFFQSTYTDNFGGGMIKIRNSETAAIEKEYYMQSQHNLGIFVDVFVLDYVPISDFDFNVLYSKIKFLRRLHENYHSFNPQKYSGLFRVKHVLVKSFFKIFEINKYHEYIVRKLKKTKSEVLAALDFAAIVRYKKSQIDFVEKKWYERTEYLPFHDIMLPVPKEYIKVLEAQYGKNWREPVKGFGQLHSTAIVDTERSYKDVLKDIESGKISF